MVQAHWSMDTYIARFSLNNRNSDGQHDKLSKASLATILHNYFHV